VGSATGGGVTAGAGGIGRHCGGTGGGITAGATAVAATTGSGTAADWEVPQNGQYATRSGNCLPQAGLIQRSFTGSSTLLPLMPVQ
jgi:hypothetical protein